MKISSRHRADIFAKAVQRNISKLAYVATMKYGAATIVQKVANIVKESETPLLYFQIIQFQTNFDSTDPLMNSIYAIS